MPKHNPDYNDPNPEKERRENLSAELQQIEAILDKTIRPGLQGDGGDIQALTYIDNILMVKYQGACGTCPSSTTGTLEAIKSILRDELNPEIEVYIAPEF
jgi:Fe-S cluster biogenesis protein NfuA